MRYIECLSSVIDSFKTAEIKRSPQSLETIFLYKDIPYNIVTIPVTIPRYWELLAEKVEFSYPPEHQAPLEVNWNFIQ